MNGLFELLSNKEWMVLPSFAHSILPAIQYNLSSHSTLGIERSKKSPMAVNKQGNDIFREYQVTKDGTVKPVYDAWGEGDVLGKMREPFVNVIPIDGPITRNGGACSYGSKDIRDWMIKAADNPYCQTHVLIINTPGGSAWAKNDFQQAIEYAHSRGQRVIALIDGLCASAGMYLVAFCDEVYVMNLKDQLGCVGVMAAFFTQTNGDKNQFTGETYREYYDPESVDKNKEIRDIANDEDATLLVKELAELGKEFRADMQAAFPNTKEEHLKGKVFNAEDVMGILCDGQMSFAEAIAHAFALADGTDKPIERTANRKVAKRGTAASGASAGAVVTQGHISHSSTNKTNINMKEKFPELFALLGVEEMQMQEEGAFMNMDLLATLNAAIVAKNKEAADAQALVASLTEEKTGLETQLGEKVTEIDTLKADHEQAIANLKVDHEQAIANLKAEHETAIAEKDQAIATLTEEKNGLQTDVEGKQSQIDALNTELQGAKDSLATAEGTIAERDQSISDLQAQVAELMNEGGEDGEGKSPATNGQGAQAAEIGVSGYVYDSTLSYEENMRRKAEFEKGE